MSKKIDDKELSHLFKLARIKEENDRKKRKKLLTDLEKILDHFSQLQEIDTDKVEPMAGGTFLENIYREDNERITIEAKREEIAENIKDEFPKKEIKKLKVPPVF